MQEQILSHLCVEKSEKRCAGSLNYDGIFETGRKKEIIFLTLTAPNVSAEELNDEIKHYNHSFKKLMERKEVKAIVKGYARKLEITYNEERDDYHPHFHVLIAVDKSYFNNNRLYISRDRWLELWQQGTKNT